MLAWVRRAVGVLLVAGAIIGGVAFYNSQVFAIVDVEVEGISELTVQEVVETAALPEGATLLRFPRAEMEQRLGEHPWIVMAHVGRVLPDGLVIHVTERTPAALVDVGEASFWIVDGEGIALGARTPEAESDLMVIRDLPDFTPVAGEASESASLANALAVVAGLGEGLRGRTRAISAPSVDLTTLITTDDVEILVGSAEEIEKKEAVALRILEEQAPSVVHINVRTVDRPTWRGLD